MRRLLPNRVLAAHLRMAAHAGRPGIAAEHIVASSLVLRKAKVMEFWDIIWLMFSFVMFAAYLVLLFLVIRDIFADSLRPGWVKALWILGVLLFPLLGCLAYMMFYGQQMTIRQSARQDVAREDMAEYIRRTANSNPAEQIAAAKKLLDEGTITGEEFQMLKAKALG